MSPRDTIELLANLDFVVERIRKESGRSNKSAVLGKLRSRLRKRPTNRQIENRLKSLTGSADPKVLEDVYRYGSSRLKSLDIRLKVKVLEELKTIKSKDLCIVVSTPRQLRSGSQNPATETVSRSLRGNTIFGDRTPSRSASRNLATETNRSHRERTNLDDHTPTRAGRKSQRGEPQTRTSRLAKNEPLLSKTLVDQDITTVLSKGFPPRLNTTPSRTSIAETGERIRSSQSSDADMEGRLNDAPSLRNASQSLFYSTELQDTPALNYDDPNTVPQYPDKLILGLSHETLRDLFNDNLYFRQKWSDSEERRQKIDRNGRLRHSLLASGSADILQTMADTIEAQNEKINSLQRQLNSQTFLQPFLTLGRAEKVPINQVQIQSFHAKMRRDFRSLSIMDYFQHPGEKSACVESRDLSELKSKVPSDMNQYPVSLVVQSLTGAAICEWVFNKKMQCTAMINTPLLEGYRHHLHAICGEPALRNLDLAAHQWVVNEELHFQEEFIPRTATKLCERLLDAIDPFMKNKRKSEAKLHIRLKSIFCAALNIKALAMIGKHVFEVIWPAHNSIFELKCMVEESSEGTTCNQISLKQEAKKVALPIVPGLCIYMQDRKLVDYSGFTTGDEEDLGQSSLVAQAVVVAQ